MHVKFGLLLSVLFIVSVSAVNAQTDLEKLAQDYYHKMVATQDPTAKEEDIDNYLALLTDDVGHAHLPWVVDDTRYPDGKEKMKEGMMFYLGAHTEFKAELLNSFVFNTSAIAIRYKKWVKGIHPQSKEPIEYTSTIMEVLELEEDKIAVIRKYHQ